MGVRTNSNRVLEKAIIKTFVIQSKDGTNIDPSGLTVFLVVLLTFIALHRTQQAINAAIKVSE